MIFLFALAVCIVLGIVGRKSWIAIYAWLGAGIVVLVLVTVAWAYRYDASKINEFYSKRDDAEVKLRTLRICLDMDTHPERWQKTFLQRPCIRNGDDSLRLSISEYEEAVTQWDRVISERRELLRARKSGIFWFIADHTQD